MRDMVFTREHFDRLADEGRVLRLEIDQLKTELNANEPGKQP